MHPPRVAGIAVLSFLLQSLVGTSKPLLPDDVPHHDPSQVTPRHMLYDTTPTGSRIKRPLSKCPRTCECTSTETTLRVEDCRVDPSADLDMLILENIHVTSLVITRSQLSELPRVVCKMTGLRDLDVSRNQLSALPWYCLQRLSLRKIDVSHNHLIHLTEGTLDRFHRLETLDVSYTRTCVDQSRIQNSESRIAKQTLKIDIHCSKQHALHKRGSQVMKNCPTGCQCFNKLKEEVILVNCSNGQWDDQVLPHGPLPGLPNERYGYVLDFTNGTLRALSQKTYLERVREVRFSHNNIDIITYNFMRTLETVRLLYLNENNLHRFSENIGKVEMKHLKEMRLGGNNWVCDCLILETRLWILSKKEFVTDHRELICGSPPEMSGLNFIDTPDSKFVCGGNAWSTVDILKGLAIPVVMFSVSFGFMSILYVSRVWLYSRVIRWHIFDDDECTGERKETDVFVCFADAEKDYGLDYLIPELERRGYKLADQRTHFIAGRLIIDNIEDCIRRSKRTILVLSNKFLIRYWCKQELNSAIKINKELCTSRLICVTLEDDLDLQDQEEAAKKYLKKKTFIKANSKDFWTYLDYFLAKKKMGKAQPDVPELKYTPRPIETELEIASAPASGDSTSATDTSALISSSGT